MECSNCRAEISEGRRFCTECGAPIPVSCRSCGSLNPPSAKFCGDCGAGLDTAAAQIRPSRQEPVPPSPMSSAERRPLTVMFCDLVGSTALAARLDPEDLREIIGAYHRRVAETVARFDGYVAKYMGDGVLVYFGYPGAHEDDAERAVRAGLALVDTSGKSKRPSGCGSASALLPAWWSSAISSARARPKSARLSARRRTWRRACNALLRRTAS